MAIGPFVAPALRYIPSHPDTMIIAPPKLCTSRAVIERSQQKATKTTILRGFLALSAPYSLKLEEITSSSI